MDEFTEASIEQQLSQLNLNEQSTSAFQTTTTSSLQQVDWRQSVNPQLRIHFTNKLYEALVPVCNSQIVIVDQKSYTLIEYAQKVEADGFLVAKSEHEFCELINEQIDKIQKGQQITEYSWRDTVAVEIRKHIVNKLIQTIVPGCVLETVDEQNSMRNLIEYAQKVECEVFETATSRSEYYKLIAEKIHIQRGVNEQ